MFPGAYRADCQGHAQSALDSIMFGIEATSFLSWHLEVAILQSPFLWKFKPSVFCFNPAQVKVHKKALGIYPKSDPIDAFSVADRGYD